MEDAVVVRYWCHLCSVVVHPVTAAEIKCPICQNGFVEEMTDTPVSDRRLSLLTPILLGMADNGPRLRRRNQTTDIGDYSENNDLGTTRFRGHDLDRELEDILRRRRRSSAAIRQLLQSQPQHRVQSGIDTESHGNGETERVILINPLDHTISVQGSLGDYLVGPGLELLLRHLAENDTSRQDGAPPARKQAMEALPDVEIKESSQCSVCLDDFEIGTEVKEMPCKHKFHGKCILPWLELHGSCPACRYELSTEETKAERERPRTSNGSRERGGGGRRGNRRRFSLPWPIRGLFSSSRSRGNPS